MRRPAALAAFVLVGGLCACGGRAPSIGTTLPPLTTAIPATTATADDSCYLVRLDLASLRTATAAERSTLLAQLREDASDGDAALRAAVQAYVGAGGRSSETPIDQACA